MKILVYDLQCSWLKSKENEDGNAIVASDFRGQMGGPHLKLYSSLFCFCFTIISIENKIPNVTDTTPWPEAQERRRLLPFYRSVPDGIHIMTQLTINQHHSKKDTTTLIHILSPYLITLTFLFYIHYSTKEPLLLNSHKLISFVASTRCLISSWPKALEWVKLHVSSMNITF